MDLFGACFELVERFSLVKGQEYASMYNDYKKWYATLDENSGNKMEAFYAKWSRKWGIRLVIALSLPFAVEWMFGKLNPQAKGKKVTDDDDDDE